jgi:hypothetical protein
VSIFHFGIIVIIPEDDAAFRGLDDEEPDPTKATSRPDATSHVTVVVAGRVRRLDRYVLDQWAPLLPVTVLVVEGERDYCHFDCSVCEEASTLLAMPNLNHDLGRRGCGTKILFRRSLHAYSRRTNLSLLLSSLRMIR